VEAAAEGFLSGSRRALSVTSFNPDFPAFVALLNDLRLPVSPTAASRNIGQAACSEYDGAYLRTGLILSLKSGELRTFLAEVGVSLYSMRREPCVVRVRLAR
jgi:hypothetical protein